MDTVLIVTLAPPHIYMRVCVHTHAYTCIYACTHTHTHTWEKTERQKKKFLKEGFTPHKATQQASSKTKQTKNLVKYTYKPDHLAEYIYMYHKTSSTVGHNRSFSVVGAYKLKLPTSYQTTSQSRTKVMPAMTSCFKTRLYKTDVFNTCSVEQVYEVEITPSK